jgi:hypothetical protein
MKATLLEHIMKTENGIISNYLQPDNIEVHEKFLLLKVLYPNDIQAYLIMNIDGDDHYGNNK